MKILIDIGHPAHLNFFRNSILALSKADHSIVVSYLQRGKLPSIVTKELKDINKYIVGKHRGTKISIIFQANIQKVFAYIPIMVREKPDLCLSVGSFTLGFICKLFGIKNIQFDDDPERKMNLLLEKITSTELYFPPIVKESKKIKHFNALKEWAYLSPKYFTPNEAVLKEYNISKKEYIFVREVSSGSLNYINQDKNIIGKIAQELSLKFTVILSLEDKNTSKQYPNNWIILREPVIDIHSLIYFSKFLISSGDSMAREGAMLGVPSIYCGFREMKANQLLIDKGMLFKLMPNKVPEFITKLEIGEIKYPEQNSFRNKLLSEWVDVTEFILGKIKYYDRK